MNYTLMLSVISALKEENSWKIIYVLGTSQVISHWAILDLYFQNFMDSIISNTIFYIVLLYSTPF